MIPKYFIGPMSKNIVDAIIEFCRDTNNKIALIPSRRQVDWDGGYVNNWTTENFSMYAKELLLQRDHAGPEQGSYSDNGFKSLEEDCKYLNLIHLDPFKVYRNIKEAAERTSLLLAHCYRLNPNILFEIGTEEAIFKYDCDQLDNFISLIKQSLTKEEFNQIKYVVIQSGTLLKGNNQIGNYNKQQLINMVNVAKKYNLLSKEHNGDYIPVSVIHEKFSLGLDAINIAPEFGLIETQTYLNEIGSNEKTFDRFWQICYDSKKWEKWVNPGFDPYYNKKELIKICGHYVLSNPDFLNEIKSQFPEIDDKIKTNIKNKLNQLYGLEA